jgi:hypothetical protein
MMKESIKIEILGLMARFPEGKSCPLVKGGKPIIGIATGCYYYINGECLIGIEYNGIEYYILPDEIQEA